MNALAKISSIFIVDRDHRSVDAYASFTGERSNDPISLAVRFRNIRKVTT